MPAFSARAPISGVVVSAFFACALSACGERASSNAAAPGAAAWSDSVRLQIPDSLFLADPSGILPLPSGGFVISDGGSGRLLVFSADGQLVRTIGSRGRGPGELLAPTALELLGDDELAVTDNPTARLARFRLSDGSALEAVRLPGPTTVIVRAPGGLWLATASVETGRTHARYSSGDASLVRAGTIPQVFVDYPRLSRNLALPALAARGDTVWVGLLGENSVHRYVGAATEPSAAVEFPRARRRGVPLDDPAWLRSEMSYEDELGAVSVMREVGALADGRVAAVHLDITATDDAFTQVGYLSVIDPRTGRGCVDLPLSIDAEGIPVLRFAEDALYTVVIREDADGEPTYWIRRLDLAALRC